MADITLWFGLGTAGMVLGILLLGYGLLLVPGKDRLRYSLLVAVPAIAAVAYALMTLEIGGVDTNHGTTVYIPRYIDWLLTTPIHVVYLGIIVGASRGALARLGILQGATIVFGLAGALVGPPLNWPLFAVGALLFGVVVYQLYRGFDDLAVQQPDGIEAMYRKLRAFVVVLWLIYPAIWVLGQAGLGFMDLESASLVVVYIDVVSKVGFGLIALNDRVQLAWMASDETVAAD
jgi:sensory rhodopsin